MARAKRTKQAKREIDKLPDARALEGATWGDLLRQDDSPLGQAQQIMYQALAEDDEEHRIHLAKKALEVCADCADAFVVLAEHAQSRKEALELYRQGTAAGERTIGPENFAELTGRFWSVLQTRPYMRAREGLAYALWTTGSRSAAIEHLQDMLRLNPNDNQGIRYTLASFFLDTDRNEELDRLLGAYDDATAAWAYNRTLLAFRAKGDCAESRQLLQAAMKANNHVPAYLVGDRFPPRQRPAQYILGDDSEAAVYVEQCLSGWTYTDGAVAWLKSNMQPATGAAPQVSAAALARLKKLPQHQDVWQVDVLTLPPVKLDGVPVKPQLFIAASEDDDAIIGHELSVVPLTSASLWEYLARSFTHPKAGKPHRPSALQVRSRQWEEMRPVLKALDIDLNNGELKLIDMLYQELEENVLGGAPPQPGLLDVPGMTTEKAAAFFGAAADFYQQAPWRHIGYESAIKVECPTLAGGRSAKACYAVVMGQSGLTFGLTLYDDIAVLRKMWQGNLSDEENAALTQATTVLFVGSDEAPEADVEAAHEHGWKVARADAYPNLFRKNRGMSFSPADADQASLMEGCLRVIADFMRQRAQSDTAPLQLTAATAAGQLNLVLTWVD